MTSPVRFLADESCDFAVVRELRARGYDVQAVAETAPAITDEEVLRLAVEESRVLLTEDKDFGWLVYAGAQSTSGVILIRYPGDNRKVLPAAVIQLVEELGPRMQGVFAVLQPGKARISRPLGVPADK